MATINTIANTHDIDTTMLTDTGWQILGYWKCNESSGSTLYDAGPLSQHLTIFGASLNKPSLVPNDSNPSVLFRKSSSSATPTFAKYYPGGSNSPLLNSSETSVNNSYVLGAWVVPYTDDNNLFTTGIASIMGTANKFELDFDVKLFVSQYTTSDGTYYVSPNSFKPNPNVNEITQPDNPSAPTYNDSYFVVSSWNNGVVQIFVNGVLIGTQTGVGGTDQSTTAGFALGALADRSQNFDGYVQDAFVAVPSGFSSSQIASSVRQIYVAGTQSQSTPSTGSLPWSGTVNVYPWSSQVLPSGTYGSVTFTNNGTRTVWLSFGGPASPNTGVPLYPFGGKLTVTDFPYSGSMYAVHNTYFGYATISVSVS